MDRLEIYWESLDRDEQKIWLKIMDSDHWLESTNHLDVRRALHKIPRKWLFFW